ncbi:MAG: 5-oxoprolinase [Planctomycetes bacterium]|nr:5-oxoprolinase [Planctomycetota bacterium]
MPTPWDIWIDTGGTFTDCVARDPQGAIHRAKVLSSSALRGRVDERPVAHEIITTAALGLGAGAANHLRLHVLGHDAHHVIESLDPVTGLVRTETPLPADLAPGHPLELRADIPAPLLAAHLVTNVDLGGLLPDIRMRLATTRGTNALLERAGAPTALFITRGFGDLLVIGDQQRPDLFTLRIERPPPLYEAVVEVPERLEPDGTVRESIDLDAVTARAEELRAAGIEAAAIALLHSYRNDDHERRLAERLRAIGFEHVTCSATLAPLIRIVPRAQTAVVDAYLGPVVASYLRDVERGAGAGRVHVMTSAGGLVRADAYSARDSLLSGPAGGVAGAAEAGSRAGFERMISLDMGGTSTDVARYDGDFEYRFEQEVAGVRIVAPALAIETVAAGGGSICRVADGRLCVGPESARADPGPACYGAGGPLTLTDVNLLLGRLDPGSFAIPIQCEPAERALAALLDDVEQATGAAAERDAVLEGLLEIGNERMASAIEQVSIQRGYDPADDTLVAFGGAGGQHACAVADRLGMSSVVIPADASLLSAVGLGAASIERITERQVLAPLDEMEPALEATIDALAEQAAAALGDEGVGREDVVIRRRIAHLRLAGQDTSLALDAADSASLRAAFAERYEAMYGYPPPPKPIEIESLRVIAATARVAAPAPPASPPRPTAGLEVAPPRAIHARFDGQWTEVPAHDRRNLPPGSTLRGPALVFEQRSATVVEPGWAIEVDAELALIARRVTPAGSRTALRGRRFTEVVRHELLVNRLTSIAREMGRLLQRTAISTNVKERLDFSCAILDPDGRLVVNAPHMPVHLGALGTCVRAAAEQLPMEPGDVVVTNHPGCGGSHLPDITVITPVFAGSTRLGYVANRAHHAEIGGTRPGSMPPDATTLAEEGVVIAPRHLVRRGQERFDELELLLRSGPWPSRAVTDNLADLRGQVAANQHGVAQLAAEASGCGADELIRRTRALTDEAEAVARAAISAFPDGTYEAREELDDGAPIKVRLDVRGDGAVLDFAGSGPTHPGNLNATPAIVTATVLYVLRLLIDRAGRSGPLNEGMMRPLDLRVPRGMLDPEFPDDPARCPAVVGGNVETSQRIVDTLLKALGLAACSQGTMNNVLIGTDAFGYYETVCGGSGAGPDFDGADAIHTHMTNTRITDVEVLEHRYPVRLEQFAIRRGSGGAGLHRGGDGAVREYRFTAPLSLSILTQHRRGGPFGAAGGAPGRPGRNRIVRSDGRVETLGSADGCEVVAGDRFVLETPGGGGYGEINPLAGSRGEAIMPSHFGSSGTQEGKPC